MLKVQPVVLLFLSALMIGGGTVESAVNESSATVAPLAPDVPAGRYILDKAHSTITFKVSHIGFSFYTGSFSRFDATLYFDPTRLGTAKLTATIDVTSLGIPTPPEGFMSELLGPDWLNAEEHPQMSYRSREVTPSGDNTALVIGDFTLNGKTVPVTLELTFNGGYAGIPGLDPNARIGFSAHGSLDRSAFGVDIGLPPEGSTMGVGDRVTFMIETEFTGPPLVSKITGN